MRRERGLAYCGLACCLCEQKESCPGCRNEGCGEREWCKNYNCCRERGYDGCWQCPEFPCETLMLAKMRIRAFARFIGRHGEQYMLDCLEANERRGVAYHANGKLLGDYDRCRDEQEVFDMLEGGAAPPAAPAAPACTVRHRRAGGRTVMETERLILREMTQDDLPDLREMLTDRRVMWAYEHDFTEAEVREWLDRQRTRYRSDGIGLWAVILQRTGEFVGQAGLTWQTIDSGERVLEIGYLFKAAHWHNGYASEAASACKRYAYRHFFGEPRVCSIIRTDNVASQIVAERIGMRREREFTKRFFAGERPHYLYSVENTARDYLRLRSLRKQENLTQQQLADRLGMNKITYARYEKGERELPLDAAIRAAQLYGVSLDYLVGLSDKRE